MSKTPYMRLLVWLRTELRRESIQLRDHARAMIDQVNTRFGAREVSIWNFVQNESAFYVSVPFNDYTPAELLELIRIVREWDGMYSITVVPDHESSGGFPVTDADVEVLVSGKFPGCCFKDMHLFSAGFGHQEWRNKPFEWSSFFGALAMKRASDYLSQAGLLQAQIETLQERNTRLARSRNALSRIVRSVQKAVGPKRERRKASEAPASS